jgi:hypothetical protein
MHADGQGSIGENAMIYDDPLWLARTPQGDGRPMYRDRLGRPLTQGGAVKLLGDPQARRVALDRAGPFEVSTEHLVLDHALPSSDTPLIFETTIFARGGTRAGQRRYATESEARDGHAQIVSELRGGKLPPALGEGPSWRGAGSSADRPGERCDSADAGCVLLSVALDHADGPVAGTVTSGQEIRGFRGWPELEALLDGYRRRTGGPDATQAAAAGTGRGAW